MSANLKTPTSRHSYLKPDLAHHCDNLLILESILLALLSLTLQERLLGSLIYLCLFTYTSTQAAHLEIDYSVDTDNFLN